MDIAKRLTGECLGTALLLAISGGCGIAAQRLSGGDAATALLVTSLVSSMGLAVLIVTFSGISGSYFNPVLTLSDGWRGKLPFELVAPYIVAQLLGALAGMAVVHGMYGLEFLVAARPVHTGPGEWLSECLATFGLVAVFIGCGRARPVFAPFGVAAYVMTACWFSSSSAFMNPALTLAKVVGEAGAIRLADAPGFVLSQLAGGAAATAVFSWMLGGARAPVRP